MYGRMVKVYEMVNIHTEEMTNMEIDQNKTCQLLGQMKTGPSSNIEMERESYSGKKKQLMSQSVFRKCQCC